MDVDETLAEFTGDFLTFAAIHGRVARTPAPRGVYSYTSLLDCTQAEADSLLSAFKSAGGLEDMTVVEGALETVTRLAAEHELVAVTGRHHSERDVTVAWLEKNFPGMFLDTLTGDHYGKERIAKSVLCHEIGAAALIDDLPAYVNETANAGVRSLLLFRNLPWQHETALHDDVIIVPGWTRVIGMLTASN